MSKSMSGYRALLATTASLIAAMPVMAQAGGDGFALEEIVVTARKRSETLKDVPVAASAVTGDLIEQRGLSSVKDIAALTPGLNINSDGIGRAFIAIRGVGVTLINTVQPGVGLFIDGIYQPNTSYLNSPLLDVERIEVLRGPQGTLYGKNTLGGAINVISRQPDDEWKGRVVASYAGPDDSMALSASISGAIVPEKLQIRLAAAHREQDGFQKNSLTGSDANPLNTNSVNTTIRFIPADDVELTVKGYYDWVEGANTPYARVSGPTDYSRSVQFNSPNLTRFEYGGVNARLALPLDALNSRVTLIAAYDQRDNTTADNDGDFGVADIVRSSGDNKLKTRTGELRLDSEISDSLSSLVGLFHSRETFDATSVTRVVPLNRVSTTLSGSTADTTALFGTLFWKPSTEWEVTAGLRYDHENREATGGALLAGVITPIPPARIKSNEIEPRLTITRHWNDGLMSYASIARGYRGGGFNSPLAPSRTYKGDSAWTYELGSKYSSADRRFALSGAVFYNDYRDYIGQNSIAPSPAGGFVTVDLNTGDVESYGLELEASFRPLPAWTLTGSATLMHARITDSRPYTAVTGRFLPTDRLTFQPDWNFAFNSDYVIPAGAGDVTLTGGITGKGSRAGSSLSNTFSPRLDAYYLVNAAITYSIDDIELQLFANNIFNEKYFDSYIDQSLLQLSGLPAASLGIMGDRARYGARVRVNF